MWICDDVVGVPVPVFARAPVVLILICQPLFFQQAMAD